VGALFCFGFFVVGGDAEETPNFGAQDEEATSEHRAAHLDSEEARAWIDVTVCWFG
jgi:hypothetical protein